MSQNQQQKFHFDFTPEEGEEEYAYDEDLLQESLYPLKKASKKELEEIENKTLNEYDENTKNTIKVLKKKQEDYDAVEAEYKRELRELREKYKAKFNPILDRRSEIINGQSEPTQEEKQQAQVETTSTSGIPDFWYKVLMHSEVKSEMITENDEDALKYLRDIQCEEFETDMTEEERTKLKEDLGYSSLDEVPQKRRGFKIHFKFAENPYFTNEILTKTFYYEDDADEITHSTGTQINWKEGKNLTVKVVTKRQRHKSNTRVRTVKREEPIDSFFNFFKELDDLDEDDEGVQELLDTDANLGELFKTDIIPNAIKYFLNTKLPSEGLWYTTEVHPNLEEDDEEEEYGEKGEEGEGEQEKEGEQ